MVLMIERKRGRKRGRKEGDKNVRKWRLSKAISWNRC